MNIFKDFFGYNNIKTNDLQKKLMDEIINKYDENPDYYDKNPDKYQELKNKNLLLVLKEECKKVNKPFNLKLMKLCVYDC